jgi:hypothetical protein
MGNCWVSSTTPTRRSHEIALPARPIIASADRRETIPDRRLGGARWREVTGGRLDRAIIPSEADPRRSPECRPGSDSYRRVLNAANEPDTLRGQSTTATPAAAWGAQCRKRTGHASDCERRMPRLAASKCSTSRPRQRSSWAGLRAIGSTSWRGRGKDQVAVWGDRRDMRQCVAVVADPLGHKGFA